MTPAWKKEVRFPMKADLFALRRQDYFSGFCPM